MDVIDGCGRMSGKGEYLKGLTLLLPISTLMKKNRPLKLTFVNISKYLGKYSYDFNGIS